MTAFSSFSNAGVAAIQAGIVNINGCPFGITGIATPNTPQPLKLMQFSKRFGGSIPQPVRATAIGDNNRSRHEYIFNAPQMGEQPFLFGSMDMDAYAGWTKTKKVADGNGNRIGLQTNAPVNAAQSCIVVNIDAQDADLGDFGLKRFVNEIYSLVTVAPLGSNLQEVQAAEWGYYGIPTQSGKLPWGVPFDQDTDGFTRAGGVLLTSDYPIVIEVFQAGAGSPTTCELTYTPATPTATYVKAWNFADGVTESISVVDKDVTFAAQVEGDILVFRYEATDLLANL